MAKKKKPTVKVKPTARAKRAQATTKPAVKAAQKVAVPVVEPQVSVTRARDFSFLERTAIAVGGILLIVGTVGVLQRPPQNEPATSVKQQTIPMSLDDFKDDPAIQDAIQKQLGGQSGTAPTPQEQHTQSPQAAGGLPQAPDSSVQQ